MYDNMNSVMSPLRVPVSASQMHHQLPRTDAPSSAVHAAMQRSALTRHVARASPSQSANNQHQQFYSHDVQIQTRDPAYYNRPSRANSRERSFTDSTNQQSSSSSTDQELALLRPRITRLAVSPDQHQQRRQHQHHQQYPTLLQQQRQHHLQRQQPQHHSRHTSPVATMQPQPRAAPRTPTQPTPTPTQPTPDPVEWRVAIDPKTKRPYYYHPITRQTTWKKPQELVDKEKRERANFFASMENNIRTKLREGNWFRDSLTARPSDLDATSALGEEDDEEDDDGHLSSSTSTSSRSSWSSTTTASVSSLKLAPSKSMSVPTSPNAHKKIQHVDNQTDHDDADMLAAAAAKPPMLFRTLSSYETPVVNETKKLVNGRLISMPSPIQERVRLAALDDEPPRSSDLESYTHHALALAPEPKSASSSDANFRRQPLRRRSNSTSTIFVRMGTMNAPDQDTTIQCVATVLRAHLMEAQAAPIAVDPKFEIFVNCRDQRANAVPTLKEIGTFIKHVFARAQMESECIIMSLIYVERLLKATNGLLQLQPSNWRSILFCSMVMASKVWDDLSMCNADFSKIWPELSLKEINDLELAYLSAVEYNVRVSAVSYAKYYFHLRSMCASLGMLKAFDESAPLNLDGARKIQVLSEEYQERSKLLPQPSRRRSVTITTPSVANKTGMSAGKADATAKWTPAASLEQLVQMQVRGAGGGALSMLPRLSSSSVKP